MRFDEAAKGLAPEVVSALQILDANGFQIFTDVRIEDCVKPDGNRRRTFSNRGRYAVGALLKNLSSRDGQEMRAFPAEIVPPRPAEAPAMTEPVKAEQPEPVAAPVPEPTPEPEPEHKRGRGRPSRR